MQFRLAKHVRALNSRCREINEGLVLQFARSLAQLARNAECSPLDLKSIMLQEKCTAAKPSRLRRDPVQSRLLLKQAFWHSHDWPSATRSLAISSTQQVTTNQTWCEKIRIELCIAFG